MTRGGWSRRLRMCKDTVIDSRWRRIGGCYVDYWIGIAFGDVVFMTPGEPWG